MVEEIITALSRFKWLFVIARNSSFTFKGKTSTQPDVFRATRYEFSVANNHCISEKLGNERAQSETSWLHQS
jgi:hypothetical protein